MMRVLCAMLLTASQLVYGSDLANLASHSHRLSGTPENDAAVRYVETRLREMGVDHVLVQPFPSVQLFEKRCEIVVNRNRLPLRQMRPNAIVPPVTPPNGITGRVLYAGAGELVDYANQQPEGAIVVLDYNTGTSWLRAFRLGAAAVVFLADGQARGAEPLYTEAAANLPRFFYDGAAEDLLAGEEATIFSEAGWHPVVSTNVIGVIRGTEPVFAFGREEYIVVSASLDSFGHVPMRSPGARGAANVAGLLGAAASWVNDRPKRNLVLAFTNNDARGYEGTRALYRAIDPATRASASSLNSRRESIREESAFLNQLAALLNSPHPMAETTEIGTQLFMRLRLAADEEIENSRARMGEIRQEIERLRRRLPRVSEADATALESEIAALESRLATLEEPHQTWNNFRRALSRGSLKERSQDKRYEQVVQIVKGEVDSRVEEIRIEQMALEADQALHELLSGWIPVLHVSSRFGDTTQRWGMIFGRYSRIGTFHDVPGLYGRVAQGFKLAASKLGERVSKFEASTITPGRQIYGGEFLVNPGEVAGRYGIFNVVAGTALDDMPREGTPADTAENLNSQVLEAQMIEFTDLLREAAGMEAFSATAPIVRGTRYVQPMFRSGRVTGTLALRRTKGSSVANRAASGAVVQVFPTRPGFHLRAPHDRMLFGASKPVAFDDFMLVRADTNGALTFGPLDVGSNVSFGIGMIFNERGEVDLVSTLHSSNNMEQRLNLLPVRGGAAVVPPHIIPGFATIMDGWTNSPLGMERSFNLVHDGIAYWYLESKISAVKVFGRSSVVALNTAGEDSMAPGGAYGAGLATDPLLWTFPSVGEMGARDLIDLNEKRLHQLRSRGVSSASLEELHARADDFVNQAKTTEGIARREAFWLSSFLSSLPVYTHVRSSLDDLVKSVLVLLALAVPFAFALERLLIGTPNIFKQIAWFAGFFCATFVLLYFTHPAFAVSNAPMIIFLGFTIIVLSGLVIWIIMQKFEIELKLLQGVATTIHSADVSRFSTLMAAMAMGISTMRRRPVRTALTATTIILLTFTILCFASFGGQLGVATRFVAPLPGYAAAFVHRINWQDLDPALLDILTGRWGGSHFIAARYWLSPAPNVPPSVSLAREDGSRPANIQGLLGIEPQEIALREDLKALFGEGAEEDSIWLTRPVAELLKVQAGDRVRLNGRVLTVRAPVESSALGALRDMDGSSVLPVDFDQMQQQDSPVTELEDGSGDPGGQAWETLAPDNVVVVTASTARSLFASMRAITVYGDETAQSAAVAEDMARSLRTPIAATREDGVYWHTFGTVLGATGARDLILPIVLGGLVVFGTMLGSVADREREIYTFSALGLAPPHVASLFFAEALVFSVLGGLGGYLTAQAVIEGLKVLADLGLGTVPEINYSSTNAIVTILIVMGTVVISAIYPAVKASRSANPGVLRSWRIPRPKGDRCEIAFPFTVSAYDVTGVVSFLVEHFENFQDTGLGDFVSKETQLVIGDKGDLGVRSHLALAPFDLGVTQDFELRSQPSEIEGIDEVLIVLERRSGQPKDWVRLNKVLLDDLRKQFLIWRSLPAEVMESYRDRTLARLQKGTTPTPSKTA